jgi:hypothetical protein
MEFLVTHEERREVGLEDRFVQRLTMGAGIALENLVA